MRSGLLAWGEQEEDSRQRRAASIYGWRTPNLTLPSAFWACGQDELTDKIAGISPAAEAASSTH